VRDIASSSDHVLSSAADLSRLAEDLRRIMAQFRVRKDNSEQNPHPVPADVQRFSASASGNGHGSRQPHDGTFARSARL
jgi:hypothetical protein